MSLFADKKWSISKMRPGWLSPVLFVLLKAVIGLFVLLDAVVGNEVEFDGQMILSIDHSLDDGASWEA